MFCARTNCEKQINKITALRHMNIVLINRKTAKCRSHSNTLFASRSFESLDTFRFRLFARSFGFSFSYCFVRSSLDGNLNLLAYVCVESDTKKKKKKKLPAFGVILGGIASRSTLQIIGTNSSVAYLILILVFSPKNASVSIFRMHFIRHRITTRRIHHFKMQCAARYTFVRMKFKGHANN